MKSVYERTDDLLAKRRKHASAVKRLTKKIRILEGVQDSFIEHEYPLMTYVEHGPHSQQLEFTPLVAFPYFNLLSLTTEACTIEAPELHEKQHAEHLFRMFRAQASKAALYDESGVS